MDSETIADRRPADRRPAYVRQMSGELRGCKAELDALEDGIIAIIAYLTSPKFAVPNRYVNVDDVLLRIEEARAAALQARGEA